MGVKVTEAKLDELFGPADLSCDQQDRCDAIRDAARAFADELVRHTVTGADQNAALRHVRLAMLTAQEAVRLHP